MKILLAPAETKVSGGDQKEFCKNNFIFPELFEKRETVFVDPCKNSVTRLAT